MATCAVENRTEENVVQKLNELFGNVLNIDIIKTVAVSCRYNITESSNKLLEITSISGRSTAVNMNRKVSPKLGSPPIKESKISVIIPPKKSRKTLDFERTVEEIRKGYKVLVIMRGVPGCGKSYLAKRVLESTIGFDGNYQLHILSADDYFLQNGMYQYDPSKISEAHGWNHNRAFQAVSRGFSPIIIDNTNTQMWEMKPYAMMATDCGYIIEILEPDTHWCSNEKELAKRNSHGVPKAKIRDMLERYEKNITPQKLLSAYNLTYRLQIPPQPRLYPPLHVSNTTSVNSLRNGVLQHNYENNSIIKSKSIAALNSQAPEYKTESKEMINLMDFNDDETTNVKSQSAFKISTTSWEPNLVDKILMCNSEIGNKNVRVLKPVQQKINEIISLDSSDEESMKELLSKSSKMFPDLETAWGVNETALRSWDIVTPLEVKSVVKIQEEPLVVPRIITKDSSCNTDEEYFHLLKTNRLRHDSEDYKLLETLNRDINHSTPKRTTTVLKIPKLDKSCLTEDIFEDYENHMSQLVNLFPSVSYNHLKYWYTKCKGDLEWTIEFILENQGEIGALIEETDEEQTDVQAYESCETDSDSSTSRQEASNIKVKKFKRHRNGSQENINLKKVIESKIDINDEHYSKHLLKVKQFKFGNTSVGNDAKPSTSNQQEQNDSSLVIDSDIEFDESDNDQSSDKSDDKPEETVELNLGENFVAQLETNFGDSSMSYPKGFQPVVQIPVSLARQLYTFYIESVCQQMENQKQVLETLIKEDEEFAKKLQAKEDERVVELKPPSTFKDIIDEQIAQTAYQKEVDKWKELTPDNLATILTRQKLFSVFPTIDKAILIEILHAHDNKYQDTVETLLASTGRENIIGHPDTIKEPPLKDEVIQEMKEAQKSSGGENYDEQHDPLFYREEANKYLKKRNELYQKAQQYHQHGMREVAQFYSGLASQQTVYYDRANNMAATAFLDEHSKRLQDFNTIDLHFLYVKEAIPALDVFLDQNIRLLRLSKSRSSDYLQIITGRGKNSENGISKIKPVVMARLKRRNIKYKQLNPGLLQIKVTDKSLITCELPSI